jgi:hypothetical protein
MAGVWLTITRGGSLFTGKVAGFTAPDAAREASSRSRAMVRSAGAIFDWSALMYEAPWSGSVGKLLLVTVKSSRATMCETLSTWVRTVAQITPNVSSLAPVGLTATADRNLSVLPSHDSTCG